MSVCLSVNSFQVEEKRSGVINMYIKWQSERAGHCSFSWKLPLV